MKFVFILSFTLASIHVAFCQEAYPTHFISVAGKKVAYKASGLQTRKHGEPVLIFEGGVGSGKESFGYLIPFLSKSLPWIMYDRTGLSDSEPDTTIKTDAGIVKRLHDFLLTGKVEPPYLLVGHSVGGAYIRLFTSFYPNEVAGLVFVDPTNFMLSKTEDEQIKNNSNSAMGYIGLYSSMMRKYSSDTTISAGIRREMRRSYELNKRGYFNEYTSLSPLPNIPVTVMIAYNSPIEQGEKELAKEFKINMPAWFAEVNKYRIQHYADMIKNNKNSSLVLLPGYQHVIHHRDPQLVSATILETYKKTLTSKS